MSVIRKLGFAWIWGLANFIGGAACGAGIMYWAAKVAIMTELHRRGLL